MTPKYIYVPTLAAALLLSQSTQQNAEALTAPGGSIGETSNSMLTPAHWYHGGEGWHRYYGWRGYYGHGWHGLYGGGGYGGGWRRHFGGWGGWREHGGGWGNWKRYGGGWDY